MYCFFMLLVHAPPGTRFAPLDTRSRSRSFAMAGSVKHILLLKFKDSVTPDQQSVLIQKYAALPNSISAMKGFEWGTDMSVENMHQGFTHVFISTFDSPEGRDEYLIHPVHEAFAKELIAALDNALVVDFKPTVVVKAA